MSKYLRFARAPNSPSGKTEIWNVRSLQGDYLLGTVCWFSHWRQYVFCPASATTFNPTCLREIAEFTADLTTAHRRQAEERKRERQTS